MRLDDGEGLGWLILVGAGAALAACGSSASAPSNGAGGSVSGGGVGASGGVGNGGTVNTGGIVNTGGVVNAGGAANGGTANGGTANGGTANGGTANGGAGAVGGSVAVTTPDAGTCDPSGTWALDFVTNVQWEGGLVLSAGSGSQELRLLSTRTYDAATNTVTDTAQICTVTLPGFHVLSGDINVIFPDQSFDGPPVTTTLISTVSGPGAGSTFQSDDNSIVVGATGPATGTWPDYTAVQSEDVDGDSHPGITATSHDINGGPGVPVTAVGPLADTLYIAFRTVAKVSGTMDSCDHGSGTITLDAIDQSILGCSIPVQTGVTTARECTSGAGSETEFINTNSPVWTPDASNPSTITMQRVSDTATCADVRNLTF
jgi:hypothetical protein